MKIEIEADVVILKMTHQEYITVRAALAEPMLKILPEISIKPPKQNYHEKPPRRLLQQKE